MELNSTTEQVSGGSVDRVVLIADGSSGEHFDKLKVTALVRLVGDKHAYQADYKVSRELLNPESPVLDQFFDEMKKTFTKVLEGKIELNAVVKGL